VFEIIKQRSKGYELSVFLHNHEIKSNKKFFTDANSLELIEREFHEGLDEQHIPASTYPVTSMIGVRDS
jgi:hypothetical protein